MIERAVQSEEKKEVRRQATGGEGEREGKRERERERMKAAKKVGRGG